jgi:hypothetical protein
VLCSSSRGNFTVNCKLNTIIMEVVTEDQPRIKFQCQRQGDCAPLPADSPGLQVSTRWLALMTCCEARGVSECEVVQAVATSAFVSGFGASAAGVRIV